MSPLLQLVLARFREGMREPGTLFWVFGFPILMTLGLGIAFREGTGRKLPVAVTRGPEQASRAARLEQDGRFLVLRVEATELDDRFRKGEAVLAVNGFTPVEYRFDPVHEEAAMARQQVDALLQAAAGRTDPLPSRNLEITAPGSRYIDFFVPGLLGMNIMSSSLWGIGWTIVQTRRRKLLKRLVATPMRRSHYLLSHVLSRLVFLTLEVGVTLTFAALVFEVEVRGSLMVLCLFALLGAVSFSGLGLLTASRTESAETVSGLINALMFPMMLLSGVFFSSSHFPGWMQPFIHALPLTLFNDGLRSVFGGGPLVELAVPAIALAALGAISFVLSLRWFRWV
jgi:ABC-type multidrug transport system permease subunit